MDNLIPVINKLQDVFNAVGSHGLDLPQIVVVGSQSSGKSSVLENLVGRDFLPRGGGIVTRRPLVLQLINLPKTDQDSGEWGEFSHLPNEMFHDFNKIRAEIQRETDRLVGTNKGISPLPIALKIYSPHVLNLTLVDLPGMTRVAVGDQPHDIEEQIRKMIMSYIEKKNAIILAVSPANHDLANSDALKVARIVDPQGERTIGVLTKCDIMDNGTDAVDILTGRVYPLKLGFIAIVNRSQADIIAEKSIKRALEDEKTYFKKNYTNLAHRCGTSFLAKTLNKLLMRHIRYCLPSLKSEIQKHYLEAQQELNSYGDVMYDSETSKGAALLQILTKFSSAYRDSIDGKLQDNSANELYGGARINYIFNEVFGQCIAKMAVDGLNPNDIRTAIRNATGPRTALFIPEIAFDLLVKKQITRLEDPSLQCVDAVYDELLRIVSQIESKELLRFSTLREKVVSVVHDLLSNCREPTKKMIRNLIQIELAFINTAHPDFIGSTGALGSVLEKMVQERVKEEDRQRRALQAQQQAQQQAYPPSQPQRPPPYTPDPHHADDYSSSSFFGFWSRSGKPAKSKKSASKKAKSSKVPNKLEQVPQRINIPDTHAPSDKERLEIDVIQSLILSYFDIVRKNIQDSIPKAIMHFLVNRSKSNVQSDLVTNLYKEDLFDELLEEDSSIAGRRKASKQMVEMLRKASQIINEIRDTQV